MSDKKKEYNISCEDSTEYVNLETTMHLDMLNKNPEKWSRKGVYGLHWGDPDSLDGPSGPRKVREAYVDPFLNKEHTALEIGPGGGRWTRYFVGMKELYVIDYHEELLCELRKNYDEPNMIFIKNNGTDFPGVPDECIDYVFSFGVFVHLELGLINEYLENMFRIVKPDANIIIQYSDKTKELSRKKKAFSYNNPEEMRELIFKNNYKIISEDTTSLPHSSVICFSK